MKATHSTLQNVLIYKFSESIFYSRLNFLNEKNEPFSVEARTSDAIAVALRCEAPIYTTEEIMETAGIPISELIDENDEDETENDDGSELTEDELFSELSKDELLELMQDAIEREDYEQASRIRDKIKQRAHEE